MSLHKYALACTNIELELIGSLTKEEINALRKRCAVLGLGGFLHWADENFAIIAPYIEMPLSQRMNVDAWNTPEVKGLLVLATLEHIGHELEPGPGYRRTVTNAADVYHEICFEKIEYWPFDAPDPFA